MSPSGERQRRRYDLERTPGYYDNEGQPPEFAGLKSFYPEGVAAFIALMDPWMADGRPEGLSLERLPAPVET